MENKRNKVRVKVNSVVLYKIKGALLGGGSRVKDISEAGACILSKHNFPVGSLLDLEIRRDDLKEPIKISAQIVRAVNRDDGQYPFELGLVFSNLSSIKQETLQEYIRCFMVQGENKSIN